MSLESDLQEYKEGLSKWMKGDVFDTYAFMDWTEEASVTALEFTHDIFLKNHWTKPCEYLEAIINIKRLDQVNAKINHLGIDITGQFN